jgi:hypothetical protein
VIKYKKNNSEDDNGGAGGDDNDNDMGGCMYCRKRKIQI